ncbi:MAG: lipopolysaccharide heptosyltransferase I [Candidatus Rokuibacteriota bacterium]
MNVALVKLSSLGDVVHALPVAATLRARLPQARLTWIVERREAAVLAGHPALDEVVTVDTRGWRRSRSPAALAGTARALRELAHHLAGARFDVALDLQGLIKSGILVALTRAPLRIGFQVLSCREPLGALFTNRRVPRPRGVHVVEQYLALAGAMGIAEPVKDFRLPSDPAAESSVDEFFGAAGIKPRNRVVVLNPGAGRPSKRWPVERFRALAAQLAGEVGAHVLVVWGPGEEALARTIAAPPSSRVVLGPPTTLAQLIGVLRRASLLVAADTGPLHLAAALGTPCLGLYGPTDPSRNGPYGPGHRTLRGADHQMTSIDVEPVFRAATGLLA